MCQAAVADNLLDRLEDCRTSFTTVAVVGGAAHPVLSRLATSRHAPSTLLVLDESRLQLDHTRRLVCFCIDNLCSDAFACI